MAADKAPPLLVLNAHNSYDLTSDVTCWLSNSHWSGECENFLEDYFATNAEFQGPDGVVTVRVSGMAYAPRDDLRSRYEGAIQQSRGVLIVASALVATSKQDIETKIRDIRSICQLEEKTPIIILLMLSHRPGRTISTEDLNEIVTAAGPAGLSGLIPFYEMQGQDFQDKALKIRKEILDFMWKHGAFDGADPKSGFVRTVPKQASKGRFCLVL